ncbi:MAG: hypothetical protein ACFFF9_14530 [Candidatus Thorarchaeota archaeon]
MKSEIMKCSGFLIGLVFVFLLFPQTAATVVWEDNFDDGTYAPEWTVTEGAWEASNGYLEAVGSIRNTISHNSSQVEGTWSFDIFYVYVENNHGSLTINYIVNGSDDYHLTISQPGNVGIGPRLTLQGGISLNVSDFVVGSETWTHFDITRNSIGETHVFVNKTGPIAEPTISIVDTTHSYSEQFRITCAFDAEGSRIDNIVVDDEILITPPATTTPETTTTPDTTPTNGGPGIPIDTTLLIVGAGVGGVVIIAGVVCMRRR